MKKKNKIIITLLAIIGVAVPSVIYAVTETTSTSSKRIVTTTICVNNELYKITYDAETFVEKGIDGITPQEIKQQHYTYEKYPECTKNKKSCQFEANFITSPCLVEESGEIRTCPSAVSANDVSSTYKSTSNKDLTLTGNQISSSRNNVLIYLNSNGTLKYKIKKIKNVKVRAIYNENDINKMKYDDAGNKLEDFKNASYFPNSDFLPSEGDYWIINNVAASNYSSNFTSKIYLEFYEDSNTSCNGTMIMVLDFNVPDYRYISVANPAIENPSKYGCDDVKKYVPSYFSKMDEKYKTEFNNIKQRVNKYCYVKNIYYSELGSLKAKIAEQFEEFKKGYDIPDMDMGADPVKNDECEAPSSDFVQSDSSGGTYFLKTCLESYSSVVDQPKVVRAGAGFSYQTQFTIRRVCNLNKVGDPDPPDPQCYEETTHTCYWPTKTGIGSGIDGGPNEDFDECVNKCDGGNYTQSCINSCYTSVYGNKRKRDLNFIDKLTNDVKSNIQSMCTTVVGNPGSQECHNGDCACISKYCSEHGWCEWETRTLPQPCDWNPTATYQSRLDSAESQLNSIKGEMTNKIPTGSYTYTIRDSYLDDGKANYDFKVSSSSNLKLKVSVGEQTDRTTTTTTTIGGWGGMSRSVSYVNHSESEVTITVNLPYSYVDKQTANAVYKSSAGGGATESGAYTNKLKSTKWKGREYYYPKLGVEENLYYTDPDSENTNVILNGNIVYPKLQNNNWNIHVNGSGLGEKGFEPNIKCYYGVYNDDPPIEPICEIKNGKYYGSYGKEVSKKEYINQCFCTQIGDFIYGPYESDTAPRKVITKEEYGKVCKKSCDNNPGPYKDENGNVFYYGPKDSSGNETIIQRDTKKETEKTYVRICCGQCRACEVDNKTIYYGPNDADGNPQEVSSLEEMNILCGKKNPYCETFKDSSGQVKYYGLLDENGKSRIVDYKTFLDECDAEGEWYIFRPIVLTDAFPNGRAPRYNWSTSSIISAKSKYNIYGVTIDPIQYNLSMVTKEKLNSFYNRSEELDYEFKLDGNKITQIKQYNSQFNKGYKSDYDYNNDGYTNYLDYDLHCRNQNGVAICTSKFVDAMFGKGNRENIAGCNNAISGRCDESLGTR